MDYKLYLEFDLLETNIIPETNNYLLYFDMFTSPIMAQIIKNSRKNESYISVWNSNSYITYGNSYDLINSFVFNYDEDEEFPFYSFEFFRNEKIILLINEVNNSLPILLNK